MTDQAAEPLSALADSWYAAASRIDERTMFGDPVATIATSNTLRSCADALRAAIRASAGPGLDVEAGALIAALSAYERNWMTSGTGYASVRAAKAALRARLPVES